ncbi:O-antigen ligase family protein [Halomarina ordinaria]|uniref:O-antigen ligase family protein n=1 Tax=Halomarina ordinaria TaxID=3033939 RepID=A0ABD5U3M7_9EURY|nr:O-antigen ligase family protein [Halomarina sp. PSRA2]
MTTPSLAALLRADADCSRTDVLATVALLVCGLFLFAPLATRADVTPLYAVVAALAGVYAYLAARRQLLGGSVVLLVTLATFSADYPLTGRAGEYASQLGPKLWLFQGPLLLALGLLVLHRDRLPRDLPPAGVALGLFALWTLVPVALGRPLDTRAAVYFALLVGQCWLTYVAVYYTVRSGALGPRAVPLALVVVLCAHLLLAVAQVVNGDSFGLSTLGEPVDNAFEAVGPFRSGTHVAGFTGMSYRLAALATLLVPVGVGLLAERWRAGALPLAVGGVGATGALLALTYTSAGQAAYLVACVALLVAFACDALGLLERRSVVFGCALLGYLALVAAIVAVTRAPELLLSVADALPLVDARNLDSRLAQYRAGFALAADHPVAGIGGGNFVEHAHEFGANRRPIHSAYLSLAAETGLVGLLLYVGAQVSVLASAATSVAERSLPALGFLCGFLGLTTLAVFDHLTLLSYVCAIPLWGLCAAVDAEAAGTNAGTDAAARGAGGVAQATRARNDS